MAILDLPSDLAPVNSFFDPLDQSVVYQDPRTSKALRQQRSQPVWKAQLEFSNLCVDRWRTMAGFLAKLKGSLNSVRLYDHSDPGAKFTGDGQFFTDGTGFDDDTSFAVITVGLGAARGVELIYLRANVENGINLPAGFKLGLPGDRLVLLTENAYIGVDIDSPVHVAPALQEAIDAGGPVTTWRPLARFFRMGADPINRDVAHFGRVTLNFIEEVR